MGYLQIRGERGMGGWDYNVQRMIDYVERNLKGDITLQAVASRLGYSPWWCTRQFSRVTGRTLRSYVRERRLSEAAVTLRDTRSGILEVALDYGFSSQEAFTRAFVAAWGLSPGAWRKSGIPIALTLPRRTFFPTIEIGERYMIEISVQEAPARAFVGLWAAEATDYCDFWGFIAKRGLNCADVEGALAGITANAQIGGWLTRGGKTGYLYGVEMPAGYKGPVPEGMELIPIPAGSYAVFHHAPYDFDREDAAVYKVIKEAVAAWKPEAQGYVWDYSLPTWQRHDPAVMGQSWCKPIKRK